MSEPSVNQIQRALDGLLDRGAVLHTGGNPVLIPTWAKAFLGGIYVAEDAETGHQHRIEAARVTLHNDRLIVIDTPAEVQFSLIAIDYDGPNSELKQRWQALLAEIGDLATYRAEMDATFAGAGQKGDLA